MGVTSLRSQFAISQLASSFLCFFVLKTRNLSRIKMAAQHPKPSVVAARNFDCEKDCQTLRDAMKGLGTDEDTIIEIICARDYKQMADIKKSFQQMFGRVLEDDLKSELGGKWRRWSSPSPRAPWNRWPPPSEEQSRDWALMRLRSLRSCAPAPMRNWLKSRRSTRRRTAMI